MTTLKSGPRILVIGAGSRGHAYARAIAEYTVGRIVGVAEPLVYKRQDFCNKFSIPADSPLVFNSWKDILRSEDIVKKEVDGMCVCTLDDTHVEILLGLRSLGLHTLCEKPVATNLKDIKLLEEKLLTPAATRPIFAVGHVLRYSPFNRLLYSLLPLAGEIVNINHTEPVGAWHFAHSYVRGNWRKEADSGPSLLTKCCHDIDLLLWFLCYPRAGEEVKGMHNPARVSSHGQLVHFRKKSKPKLAGNATNCYSCSAERLCSFSAKRIYVEKILQRGHRGWPVKIVVPEIDDVTTYDDAAAEKMLEDALKKDYPSAANLKPNEAYYGRCVYEADNDVTDNQTVVLEFEDEDGFGRNAKTATLTMIAHTEAICDRQTKIYGTVAEITADSRTITVYHHLAGEKKVYTPKMYKDSNHGGGDQGLAMAWVRAMERVFAGEEVEKAQREELGVTLEECLRSHEVVFWADRARVLKQVLGWEEWRDQGEN